MPVEQRFSLADGQRQQFRLVRVAWVGGVRPFARPVTENGFDEFANGLLRGGIRAKIKRTGQSFFSPAGAPSQR